jgi:glycosyltransferase involved in cell wall biosynthesis
MTEADRRAKRQTKRVAHLTSVHTTFDNRIFHKECGSLVAAGFQVFLVSQYPHDETVDGVHLVAIPKPKNRWQRILRTMPQVARKALALRADLYHFHDPELIPAGAILRVLGKRVIYDAHEDLPNQLRGKSWLPKPLKSLVAHLITASEWMLAKLMSGNVVVSRIAIHRLAGPKTIMVENLPRLSEGIAPGSPERFHHRCLTYIGAISATRGAEKMLDALTILNRRAPTKLILAGRFDSADFEAKLRKHPSWPAVDFRGVASRDQVQQILRESTIGLAVLQPIQQYIDTIPTKLYEYMQAGLPMIVSNFHLNRDVLEPFACAKLVDASNSDQIAEAAEALFADPAEAEAMGNRGRKAVLDHFHWDREAEKLIALYDRILGIA